MINIFLVTSAGNLFQKNSAWIKDCLKFSWLTLNITIVIYVYRNLFVNSILKINNLRR